MEHGLVKSMGSQENINAMPPIVRKRTEEEVGGFPAQK